MTMIFPNFAWWSSSISFSFWLWNRKWKMQRPNRKWVLNFDPIWVKLESLENEIYIIIINVVEKLAYKSVNEAVLLWLSFMYLRNLLLWPVSSYEKIFMMDEHNTHKARKLPFCSFVHVKTTVKNLKLSFSYYRHVQINTKALQRKLNGPSFFFLIA